MVLKLLTKRHKIKNLDLVVQFNYQFVDDGIKLFFKSDVLEKYFKNCKYRLVNPKQSTFKLNNQTFYTINNPTLRDHYYSLFSGITDLDYQSGNLQFITAKGLSKGIYFIIKSISTDEMMKIWIEKTFDDLNRLYRNQIKGELKNLA